MYNSLIHSQSANHIEGNHECYSRRICIVHFKLVYRACVKRCIQNCIDLSIKCTGTGNGLWIRCGHVRTINIITQISRIENIQLSVVEYVPSIISINARTFDFPLYDSQIVLYIHHYRTGIRITVIQINKSVCCIRSINN